MIPPEAAQRRAADPGASVWVDASAGSGKTKVLVDRVLRLLLGAETPPVAPQRILCLTFTAAAASEMANRLNRQLAAWAVAADTELDTALTSLTGTAPSSEIRAQARRLLAVVLDAPGGPHIQTIHAFCQALLRRFPFEAHVAPYFEVIDERTAQELMADTQNALFAQLGGPEQTPADATLRAALDIVVANSHETTIGALFAELADAQPHLRHLISRAGSFDAFIDAMHKAIGITRGAAPGDILHRACTAGDIDKPGLERLAAALGTGSDRDRERGATVNAWIAGGSEYRAANFNAYCRVFLTGQENPRKVVATKAVLKRAPECEDVIANETRRLEIVIGNRKRAMVASATTALLTIGNAILTEYESRKHAKGWLDFDDLINKTRDLLTRPGTAPWVLFKLDGGLDHILIDEAQDTSPEQWDVVRGLAEEFFAGEGARPETRTVFGVGDPKQSIYSFQRANPVQFSRMRRRFAEKVQAAGQRWEDVALDWSFRSTEPVLAAVDAVFAEPEAHAGMVFDGREVRHTAHRAGHAGEVELWPFIPTAPSTSPEPWKPPVERVSPPDAMDVLACQVADAIHSLCRGARLESQGRAVRPGDILILVRRRNRFLEELLRRLKEHGVPVAGSDRQALTDHIAVMDLMALGRFLLHPGDNLSLAEALKSPLFGLDDDDLFSLAHGRGPQSLWQRLNAAAGEDGKHPRFGAPVLQLRRLLARADSRTPYELYAGLLAAEGGRRCFYARLGEEAVEPLNVFLAQALEYELGNIPSLQGFLHWLESGDVDVKRDQNTVGGGAVRVMTVHGAKGLEAPIVFLPDTMQLPPSDDALVWAPDRSVVVWPVRKEHWDPVTTVWRDKARERRMEEYNRLLYVAMTRAEDRLIIGGWQAGNGVSEKSWYAMVERAMAQLVDAPEDPEAPLILQSDQTIAPTREEAPGAPAEAAAPPPSWLYAPATREAAARPRTSSAGTGGDARMARGERLHSLLQAWPDLPANTSDTDRALVERVVALVRDDSVFAPIFGPRSHAEAPVAAPGGFSGRIDRLAVTDDAVLAVDFKTGGNPARPAVSYLRQMAVYRSALRQIFPGCAIHCALVWLDHATLTPLPDAILDRHVT